MANHKQYILFALLFVCLVLPSVSAYFGNNLDNGLISGWNMEKDYGTTNVLNVVNASANGTLTTSGQWNSNGIIGNATSYDGVSQIMDSPFYLPVGNLSKSVSIWVNITDTGQGQAFFSGGSELNSQFFSLFYDYSGGAADDLYFFCYNHDFKVLNNGVLTTGVWHNFVVTYDQATANTTVYYDGVPVASNVFNLNTGNADEFIIGKYDSTGFMNGRADEVYVWNRALNQSEVMQVYTQNNTLPPIVPPTAPNITINSPLPQTYTNGTITINITSTGTYTWFNVNGTNQTYTIPFDAYFSDGAYTLFAFTNNTNGTASTTTFFIVNTASPSPPTVTHGELYNSMNEAGAGLGLFILYIAKSLPILLLILGVVGIVVIIGNAIKTAIVNSFRNRK